MRNRLEVARDRLERLRASSPPRARVLAARLVEIYKADAPDALTVILESDGFGDLLERTEFLERISDQDREITDRVRGLRDQAKDQAIAARRPRGAGAGRGRARSCASATRSPRSRTSSSAPATSSPSARADQRGALAQVREQPRRSSRATSRRSRREQARVQAALQGAGQPSPGRSGTAAAR